jgi:hypothetical protein
MLLCGSGTAARINIETKKLMPHAWLQYPPRWH